MIVCVICLDGLIVNYEKFLCDVIFVIEVYSIWVGIVVVVVCGVGICVVFIIFVMLFR